ncbi:nucleotidyltransferase domain-containing protein [Trichocoleus sp. ST-U3]
MMMRGKILETLINTLQPIDFVFAFWQGGSAAHGYTDEWSDLDIQVTVEDERVEETFSIVENALETISKIRFKLRVPEPTWHGHSQCFYQLESASPFLMIDFVLMKRSNPNHFLEFERHGNLVVAFDKANLIVQTSLNQREHMEEMKARLEILRSKFDFLQVFVKKEINRGRFVEAIANYHNYTMQPLIEVLGMVYRPNRYDFKTKYFSRDFPPDVIANVSSLYGIENLANLAEKQQLAEKLFAEATQQAETKLFAPL